MLRKRNVSVRLKTVITKKNYLQVSAMKQLCSSLDLKYQHSPVINARADFSREPIGERLNKEQLSTYYDCFLASASCDELSLLQAPKPKRTKVFPCSVGTTIFAVNPFAEMTFCIPLNKKIGDLREQSFKEIWQNSPQVLELRKLKQENIFECVNCRVSNSCMRCQGSNFSETGSITGISTQFCDLARTEKRAIQKFIAMKRTKKQATQTNLNTKQTV